MDVSGIPIKNEDEIKNEICRRWCICDRDAGNQVLILYVPTIIVQSPNHDGAENWESTDTEAEGYSTILISIVKRGEKLT